MHVFLALVTKSSNYNVINVLSVISKHAAAKKEESSSDDSSDDDSDSSDDEVCKVKIFRLF